MTKTTKSEITHTIAKTGEGGIQINFTLPKKLVEDKKKSLLKKLAKEVEVPGFRKGMAPADKVESSVGEGKIVEGILQELLPKAFVEVIQKEKIKPAIYPKYEVVSAKTAEDWQVKASTCEVPEIKLGDYKKIIEGELRSKAIWTPAKGEDENKKKEPTREEKEQIVISTLIEKIEAKIPTMLVDEEVNARLSKLLERIEKLGLTLENYLASIGKTSDSIRDEYRKQAGDTLKFELILNAIIQKENVEVGQKEVEEASQTLSKAENKPQPTEEELSYIGNVLKKRKALDSLISLV